MAIEVAKRDPEPLALPREKVDLIKRTLVPEATDDELELLIHQAQRTGLDPLSRQIYGIHRWNAQAKRKVMTIQVSIDGARLVADRTNKYAGQLGPQWCGDDGEWRDVWLSPNPPAAARVGILRSDFAEPLWAVAAFSEYAQTNREGDLTAMWRKFPSVMIAKCAESLGLRKAFPAELSGIYSDDEMAQADNPPRPQITQREEAQPPSDLRHDSTHPPEPKPRYTAGDAFRRAKQELKDLPVPSAEADMRFNWVADTFGEDSDELREVRQIMDKKLVGEAA